MHGYYVALFDILGFEDRLNFLGLKEVLSRYERLIDAVNYRATHEQHVFGALGFAEAPYWSAEGDVVLFTKIRGAYASDSILLWANRTWPEVIDHDSKTFLESADNPEYGWKYQPIPCDNFLDVCNDLMCRGVEVGLPMRGAISIGEAILDSARNIFIGSPIVEAARLERARDLIGVNFCESSSAQFVPPRYRLDFCRHVKPRFLAKSGTKVLDWPRHWRKTRRSSLELAIDNLDTNTAFSHYYRNTIELAKHSQQFGEMYEATDDTSIRGQYAQFSWSNSNLAVHARAVRRVPIEE